MKRFLGTVAAVALGGAGAYGLVELASVLTPFSVVGSRTLTVPHSMNGGGTLVFPASAEPVTNISYADFISIMLTGVSLILAALGFVVALLAFIGWNSIGERVSGLARSYLQDAIKEGGSLHTLVKNEANAIIYRGMEPVDRDFEEARRDEEAQ